MQQWDFIPFMSKLFDAGVDWTKGWWEEDFESDATGQVRIAKSFFMMPFVAPVQKNFIEKLKIKPDVDPEQHLQNTVSFIRECGSQIFQALIINPGELDKTAVVKKITGNLPISMLNALCRAATSPPVCSAVLEDIDILMRLHQDTISGRRTSPQFFQTMQALRNRSLSSLIDMEPFFPALDGSDNELTETQDKDGGNIINGGDGPTTGQYL